MTAPAFHRLLARDIDWCLDVFADDLAAEHTLSLAREAARLDPDFAGVAARLARVAALAYDSSAADAASKAARRLAETVTRHDDPLYEALSSAIVVACLERLGADPPWRARIGWLAESWRAADRNRTVDALALARHHLTAIRELRPIWSARDRVVALLESLIATTEWACGQSLPLRHRIARGLRAGPDRPGAATQTRFASLAAHRSEPMYDPLRRDLERIAHRVFTVLSGAVGSTAR